MRPTLKYLLVSLGVMLGQAQAATHFKETAISADYRSDVGGSIIQDQIEKTGTGDLSLALNPSTPELDARNVDYLLAGSVRGTTLRAYNSTSWDIPDNDGLTTNAALSDVWTTQSHRVRTDNPGMIRFKLDYTTSFAGAPGRVGAYLSGFTNVATPDGPRAFERHYFQVGFPIGRPGPLGSHTLYSEWLPYSSLTELDASYPYELSSIAVTAVAFATSEYEFCSRCDFRPSGYTEAFSSMQYSYEIMPVPEAETYGLMLAGLGALVLRRRKPRA